MSDCYCQFPIEQDRSHHYMSKPLLYQKWLTQQVSEILQTLNWRVWLLIALPSVMSIFQNKLPDAHSSHIQPLFLQLSISLHCKPVLVLCAMFSVSFYIKIIRTQKSACHRRYVVSNFSVLTYGFKIDNIVRLSYVSVWMWRD